MAGRDKTFEQSGTDAGAQAAEFVDTPANEPGDHAEPSQPTNRPTDRETDAAGPPSKG